MNISVIQRGIQVLILPSFAAGLDLSTVGIAGRALLRTMEEAERTWLARNPKTSPDIFWKRMEMPTRLLSDIFRQKTHSGIEGLFKKRAVRLLPAPRKIPTLELVHCCLEQFPVKEKLEEVPWMEAEPDRIPSQDLSIRKILASLRLTGPSMHKDLIAALQEEELPFLQFLESYLYYPEVDDEVFTFNLLGLKAPERPEELPGEIAPPWEISPEEAEADMVYSIQTAARAICDRFKSSNYLKVVNSIRVFPRPLLIKLMGFEGSSSDWLVVLHRLGIPVDPGA